MTKTDKNLTKNPLNTDELYFRDQLTGEIGPLAVIVGGRCFLRMISCLVYYVLASQLSEERKLQEKKKKQQQRDTTAEGPSPSKKRKTNMLAAPLRKRSREEHIKDIRQHLVETYPPCATHFKKMSPESLSRFFEDITAHCGHQMGEKDYNHTVEDYLEYKNEGQEAEERNDGKKKRYHSYIYTFPANSENIEVEAVEKKPDYLPDSICKGSKYMGTIEKEIHTGKVINVAIFHLKEEQGEVSQMNSRFMECFENSIVDTHLVKPLEESKGTLFAWSTKRLKEIADGGIELERELEKAEVEEAIEDYKKKKKAQERKQQREKKKKDKSKEDPNQTKLDQYYSPSKSSAEEEEEEEEVSTQEE